MGVYKLASKTKLFVRISLELKEASFSNILKRSSSPFLRLTSRSGTSWRHAPSSNRVISYNYAK